MPQKNQTGFTLIELLVVIAIIGILSSIVTTSVNSARAKAKIAKVQMDLLQIKSAITMLANDTDKWPGREAAAGTASPQPVDTVRCTGGGVNEVQNLNDAQTGLTVSHASYPGWNGPYMTSVPLDPWGRNYFFDTDYDHAPTGDDILSAALGSYGPNGVGNNLYDSDDIIIKLATATCP